MRRVARSVYDTPVPRVRAILRNLKSAATGRTKALKNRMIKGNEGMNGPSGAEDSSEDWKG